jgi:hypothetical protein
MPFKKGESGNPSGRPPGSANKISREIRLRMAQFVDDNIDGVKKWFEALEDKDKLFYFKEFLPFVIPKMKEITGDDTPSKPLFNYDKMSLDEKKTLFELLARYTGDSPTD